MSGRRLWRGRWRPAGAVCAGWPAVSRSGLVDRRERWGLGLDLARGVLPRLLVGAVLRGLLEGVVDEGLERGVVLLQADPVGLLGERLADQLEGVLGLVDQ